MGQAMDKESLKVPDMNKTLADALRPESGIDNFKILVDSAPGMIDVYDYTTGRYVYVNPAAEHIIGYKPEELLAGGLEFITSKIHPDDIKKSVTKNSLACKEVENLKSGINDNKPFSSFEYRVRHKLGHWVWLHTDASVYSRSKDGKLKFVINTCVDITEQKLTEAKLHKLTKKLDASRAVLAIDREQLISLNNAKDDFISIASHQLRTPATCVKQYISMLMDGYAGELTMQQQEMLKKAYDSNEWQLKLVNDLLKIIKIDADNVKLHKKRFNLVEFLEDIKQEMLNSFKPHNQTLVISIDKKPLHVTADKDFMRMVLENLIDNASKYSAPGSQVEVKVVSEDDFVKFSVTDQGIGISKKDQLKLFQKFSRLQNASKVNVDGSGLGLYWVKKTIDLHEGTIEVESKKGKGTTFCVRLPMQ
jgi:PAS domain S-box-containing protein